jgi:hypothetical protein
VKICTNFCLGSRKTVSGTDLRCRSGGPWWCRRLASKCRPAGRQDRAVKTLKGDCQEINQKSQQCAPFSTVLWKSHDLSAASHTDTSPFRLERKATTSVHTVPNDLSIYYGVVLIFFVVTSWVFVRQFPYILLSTLTLSTFTLCSSLSVSDQVQHPYKTIGKIISV